MKGFTAIGENIYFNKRHNVLPQAAGTQRTELENSSKNIKRLELFQSMDSYLSTFRFKAVLCVSATLRENCSSISMCTMVMHMNNRNAILTDTVISERSLNHSLLLFINLRQK